MYLVTGCAGFIGMHLCLKLLSLKKQVVGIDNINNYYSVELKKERIKKLKKFPNFNFHKFDITNYKNLNKIKKNYKFKKIINLAAQAGVRYSIINPSTYFENNLKGFFNILKLSKELKVKHLVYASSSSVYGGIKKNIFKEKDRTDYPMSFYAATKKNNEHMAHSFSNIYNLPTTGIRYFSVYGPWGRPDMALFIFTKKLLKKKIDIFNYGNMERDFTYIDDAVSATIKAIHKIPQKKDQVVPYKILNIGGGKKIDLIKFIKIIEKSLKIKAKKNYKKIQIGDVKSTLSDIKEMKTYLNFQTKVSIKVGIQKFIKWYKNFYEIK